MRFPTRQHWPILKILKYSVLLFILISLGIGIWLIDLNTKIKAQLNQGWFRPPIEYYTAPLRWTVLQKVSLKKVSQILEGYGYKLKKGHRKLIPLSYNVWPLETCLENLSEPMDVDETELERECVLLKTEDSSPQAFKMIFWNQKQEIVKIYSGQPLKPDTRIELDPQLFAQFDGEKPILRKLAKISEIPLSCLQSITAIEDSQFLEHSGVSVTGIARAMVRNLLRGRVAQGGSTITQQLVKNYFLTSERTFRRKFKELFMSIILELHANKDEILQSYLNVIYMGQNGPFEVRGYKSASDFYFAKPLEDLELHECALLSAIVNSPGRYNPFYHPERALQRRNLVLDKMLEHNMINAQTHDSYTKKDLPQKQIKSVTESAPYFIQAVKKKLVELQIPTETGVKIYTTLQPEAQKLARLSLQDNLAKLTQKYKNLKEQEDKGRHLEGLLISADVETGGIVALVGGRSYRKTQYNRAIESHRQVGSIMKPLVYLAALESLDEKGQNYNPLTIIEDTPFEYKYEGQLWEPRNYENKFLGPVPLFYALKNSMNVPTAKLGLKVGLNTVIDVSRRVGIQSELKPFPAMTLGAFELYPLEVLQTYLTFARMGEVLEPHLIRKIENLNGELLYEFDKKPQLQFAPETVAELVGMLKQTTLSGTARSLTQWRNFLNPSAGKTGTTSDSRDAWFSGFTPFIVTTVWVGYDDNRPHDLTGSSGALPIWAQYMKGYAAQFPAVDFTWPDNTEIYRLPIDKLRSILNPDTPIYSEQDIELLFRKNTAPDN